MPPARGAASRGERGFALIIVLWALVLIAFVTAHVVGSGRVELRIAGNLAANAVTEAAADGAVYQAVFNLLDPQPETRWGLDGASHDFQIGGTPVSVRVEDEAGRINPNLAPPELMEALLRVTGSDAESARRIAAAIGDWTGSPVVPRPPEAIQAEYRAAGLDYGPPGEPFQTVDELRRVLGVTPAIFAALRPHLSLFAALEPVLDHADPVVAAAVAETGVEQPGTPRPTNVLTARISVAAAGANKARARRLAVVRIVPASRAYVVLSWVTEPE